jgi:hypothetical protein
MGCAKHFGERRHGAKSVQAPHATVPVVPFRIEIMPYRRLRERDPEDSTVSEAIETLYVEGPEVLLHFSVSTRAWLRMSGGVSDIYKDIVWMLKTLEAGTFPFEQSFLCSYFTAVWTFSETKGLLEVETAWTSVRGYSGSELVADWSFNDVVPSFVVDKAAFVAEWLTLLDVIHRDLRATGYADLL